MSLMTAKEVFEGNRGFQLRFEARGNRVLFNNPFFLFGDDREPPPMELLLTVTAVGGNYGEVLNAEEVARYVAEVLNAKVYVPLSSRNANQRPENCGFSNEDLECLGCGVKLGLVKEGRCYGVEGKEALKTNVE